jgi:hypothetical protein
MAFWVFVSAQINGSAFAPIDRLDFSPNPQMTREQQVSFDGYQLRSGCEFVMEI